MKDTRARALSYLLLHTIESRFPSVNLTVEQAETLRRAQLTLHAWAEHECDGAIQRDGEQGDGAPYWHSTYDGKRLGKCPDRERGALARVQAVCDVAGLAFYHQGDPRGCALYVAPLGAGMNESNYSSVGVGCIV